MTVPEIRISEILTQLEDLAESSDEVWKRIGGNLDDLEQKLKSMGLRRSSSIESAIARARTLQERRVAPELFDRLIEVAFAAASAAGPR